MLIRIAELGRRLPRHVLAVAATLIVAATLVGIPVVGHLSAGGFTDPAAESTVADTLLAEEFDAGEANLVFEVVAPDGADSPAARAEGTRVLDAVRGQPHVETAESYWTAPGRLATSLRSTDSDSALVVVTVAGGDELAPERAATITDAVLAERDPAVAVTAGGQAMAYHEATTRISTDLLVAEAVAVPLTALVLIWVFGSVIAALVPLAVGLVAMLGTLAILRGLTLFTDVSIYALNLTTALGLALAVDYSLFVVNRYREEVRSGMDGPAAVRRAMETAGRTVLFSAVTVALSLAALLVFPVYFLRSFAYAGLAVVALAAAAALLVLPALLTLLGPRIDAIDARRRNRRAGGAEPDRWYRVATAVMRRPVLVGVTVTTVLLVLAAPFLGVRFGYPDDRVLPADASARQLGDSLRAGYDVNASGTLRVVLPDTADTGDTGDTGDYARRLSTLEGTASVTSAGGTYADGRTVGPGDPGMSTADSSYVTVYSGADPASEAGRTLLSDVESTAAPGRALVTGQSAKSADSVAAIGEKLPLAMAWIAITTFVLLFLFTGSIVLPVKALVLNVLSLSATFGAMVWIFQDGNLIGLYGSTATGYLVATMPLLMFCLAFGTSMDYEVFLLSRIREHWLTSGRTAADNRRAVALGLAGTARTVTAAAGLMAIVFISLATGSVSFMQMFGTGLALAVLMDATVIRSLLVPAFMRLAGRANWWAPLGLARWHARHAWRESGTPPPEATRQLAVVDTGRRE